MSQDRFGLPSSLKGEELDCRRWMPPGEPVASIQLVHGMTEHIGRYADFAEHLNCLGLAVYGHDHLGHGGTSDEKGFIAEEHGDDRLVDDMGIVFDRMASDLPGIPHFVMGHSMGSFVTRRFLTLGKEVDGAVIMGTGNQPGYQLAAALSLARLLCMVKGKHHRSRMMNDMVFGNYSKRFTEPDLPNRWLCSDPEALRAYDADPDCGFQFTDAAYRDLFTMIRRVEREEGFERIPRDLPVLMVSGADDPVGDFGKGVEKAAEGLRRHGLDPMVRLYPGMRHEILNERDHGTVYRDISDWLMSVVDRTGSD